MTQAIWNASKSTLAFGLWRGIVAVRVARVGLGGAANPIYSGNATLQGCRFFEHLAQGWAKETLVAVKAVLEPSRASGRKPGRGAVSLHQLVAPLAPGVYTGVPQVARLAAFCADAGPAVLVTTPERRALFQDSAVLGRQSLHNPGVAEWHGLPTHIVLDIDTALEPFPHDPETQRLELRVGATLTRDAFLERLELYGFEREDGLDASELGKLEGHFRVLGDTLELTWRRGTDEDETLRLRAEFFGDELEKLSVNGEAREYFGLEPLDGFIPEAAWDATRLEVLPGRVYLDGLELVAHLPENLATRFWAHLQQRDVIAFAKHPELQLPEHPNPFEPLPFYRARLKQFGLDARTWLENNYRVVVALKHQRSGEYLRTRVLEGANVKWSWQAEAAPGQITFTLAQAEAGFVDRTNRLVVVTEDLLYGFQGSSSLRGRKLKGPPVHDALALAPGDYLIHPEHGIGQFQGLEARAILGKTRDYLVLRYASKDSSEAKIYLPVEQLPLLRRHPGTTDDPPRLSILGTNEWSRTREKARQNAEELAQKLLVQYAARQATPGTPFAPIANDWDARFEENFPHQFTSDQDRAIREVLRDLEKAQPMDRLVSGDVGFGKTEVAVRAAQRIVSHGHQVAVLVPTTLLAEQHLETFRARFDGTPIIVAGLSRFTSNKDAEAVMRGLRQGSVDIVVGTHRILAQDLEFKKLGLLVIDEEHRFGVMQKEKLKALKSVGFVDASGATKSERRAKARPKPSDAPLQEAGSLDDILGNVIGVKPTPKQDVKLAPEHAIDVLSLSATPIPRTLYMSMVGLRDISHIATPPAGRKPIRTVLSPFEQGILRDAIMNEIERGGKTFYIHDRVASIQRRARYLQLLVPEARIGIAHGQMNDSEIEEIMLGFEEGAFDILVATTIVESGLDIPEANTILIERADRLGLAQLYQLRGRVGRRATAAYAYLFHPPRLTETAERRLWAIADLADLGSGHMLAEKDMEIRGIGNILGPEQHGHIQMVSLEVYTELLAEAIAKLKGELKTMAPRLAIDLAVDARLTPEYLPQENERIECYGRLSESTTLGEISRVEKELRAQHGALPREVQNFLELAKLRVVGTAKGVMGITESMTQLVVNFGPHGNLDYDARALKNGAHKVEVTKYPPGFKLEKKGLKPDEYVRALLDTLYMFA